MKWNSLLLTVTMFFSFSICQMEEGDEEEREEEEAVARVLELPLSQARGSVSPS